MAGESKIRYRHNVAHDGSVSRLLSILQLSHMVSIDLHRSSQYCSSLRRSEITLVSSKNLRADLTDTQVWPGMGSEVAFELYSKGGCYFLRVLCGGEVLESSHPAFERMEMVPVETVLAYFDGLTGRGGKKVPGLCRTPECAVDGEGCEDD